MSIFQSPIEATNLNIKILPHLKDFLSHLFHSCYSFSPFHPSFKQEHIIETKTVKKVFILHVYDTRNAKTVKSVLTTSSEKAKKIYSWFATDVKIICFLSDKTFHLVTLMVSQTFQPFLIINLAFPLVDKTNKDFQPCIQQSS